MLRRPLNLQAELPLEDTSSLTAYDKRVMELAETISPIDLAHDTVAILDTFAVPANYKPGVPIIEQVGRLIERYYVPELYGERDEYSLTRWFHAVEAQPVHLGVYQTCNWPFPMDGKYVAPVAPEVFTGPALMWRKYFGEGRWSNTCTTLRAAEMQRPIKSAPRYMPTYWRGVEAY